MRPKTFDALLLSFLVLFAAPLWAQTDSDSDGLDDSVETNTGIYIDATNTGTDPNNPDSDGDGVGDWYEVAVSFTSPVDPSDKPNVPYPLPDPDPADTGVTNKPVKVYILAGQSNMEGWGRIAGTETGTLQYMTQTENKFPHLVTDGGAWAVRNDVYYRGVISDVGAGALKADVAGTSFGPELGVGFVLGHYHDEPVLLIKASKGAQRLGSDILPPGSLSFEYGADTYAGYGDSPYTWTTGSAPTPTKDYGGRTFDTFFLDEADWAHPIGWADATEYTGYSSELLHNGAVYMCKLTHTSSPASEPGVGTEWATYWRDDSVVDVVDTLDNFNSLYPQWAAQGFEIAGFVWWQGHTDQWEPLASRYEQNLVRLIQQLRLYYSNRYPGQCATNAPFVLATLAYNGWDFETAPLYGPASTNVLNGQLAVSGETGNYPEFAGNVKTAEARGYWRDSGPSTELNHYFHNAETYLLVGDALGRAMIDLLQGADPPPPAEPVIWLSGSSRVVTNAAPGTLVGAVSMLNTNGVFSFTMATESGDDAYFNIASGSNELRTASSIDKGSFDISIVGTESGGGGLIMTNDFTILVDPVPPSWPRFIVPAEVQVGAANGTRIGTVKTVESAATFSIVSGADFVYFDGDELKLTNSAMWGGVGTTNFVTLQANTSLGMNELVVAVRVVRGALRQKKMLPKRFISE